jgi:hypothetical protein
MGARLAARPHSHRPARLGGSDSHAHIDRGGALGQCSHRNKIHSSGSIRPHVFQRDSSSAFDWNTPVVLQTHFHRFANIFDAHMIKQNCFCAVIERQLQFIQRPHFNFDRLLPSPVAKCMFEGRAGTSGERNMVALDQDTIREVEPVILSAAATHRILINHAQAGRRFACVENACLGALHSIHKLASRWWRCRPCAAEN